MKYGHKKRNPPYCHRVKINNKYIIFKIVVKYKIKKKDM